MTPLVERLEGAERGSRELDREIGQATGILLTGDKGGGIWGAWDGHWTTSLDAALVLTKRVLPGWVTEICLGAGKATVSVAPSWWRSHHDQDASDTGGLTTSASTPALALAAAILRALEASTATEGGRG